MLYFIYYLFLIGSLKLIEYISRSEQQSIFVTANTWLVNLDKFLVVIIFPSENNEKNEN